MITTEQQKTIESGNSLLTTKRNSARLAKWFLNQSRGVQVVLRALTISLATFGSAILSAFVALTLNLGVSLTLFVISISTLGIIVLVTLVYYLLSESINKTKEERDAEKRALLDKENHDNYVLSSAREMADQTMLTEIEWLSTNLQNTILVPADPEKMFHLIIQATFDTLNLHFAVKENLRDRIEFEVSFMTISYIDGGITIPASANRHGRRPRSMIERAGNPQRYNSTVTADVYRDEHHRERFVEDTNDKIWQDHYKLYPNQRATIRSAIVWPVLSADANILGTMVMHCDRPKFFLEKDRDFWSEFCEVFTKRLAHAKLQLDQAVKNDSVKVLPF